MRGSGRKRRDDHVLPFPVAAIFRSSPAGERAAEGHRGTAFVAGAESLEGVRPREAAFDDPALFAQTGAVGDAAAGDARGDAAGA